MNAAERMMRRAQLIAHKQALKAWQYEVLFEMFKSAFHRLNLIKKNKELTTALHAVDMELEILQEKSNG